MNCTNTNFALMKMGQAPSMIKGFDNETSYGNKL